MNKAAFVVAVLFFAVPAAAAGLININMATQAQLETLNGIGPTKAKAIIDYREAHGPFARIEDIVQVSGIGEKTFESIRSHITVEAVVASAPTPVPVTTAASPVVEKTPPPAEEKIAPAIQEIADAPLALPSEEGSRTALWLSLGALAVLLGSTVTTLRYIRPVPATETFPTAEEFEIES